MTRRLAMTQLGNGLSAAKHEEEALSVREAQLSMCRRLGASEQSILVVQGNLAITYQELGRLEEAMCLRRDVYSGDLRLYGKERKETLIDACNYANDLLRLERFEEVKRLLRGNIPVVRRVVGESHDLTFKTRSIYALALCRDPDAMLDDLREAVATFEELEQTTRRVLGGAHPTTKQIVESDLRDARAALAVREESAGNSDVCAVSAALDAMKAT